MIQGLVRSPSYYFDLTPTGQITNKFSNDLGILDNTLGFTMIDCMEGIIISIIMLVNVFTIDLFFLIPGIITIFFLVGYFLFCKNTNIKVKELDLRKKSPVFSLVNEVISGLIQVRIFSRRSSLID